MGSETLQHLKKPTGKESTSHTDVTPEASNPQHKLVYGVGISEEVQDLCSNGSPAFSLDTVGWWILICHKNHSCSIPQLSVLAEEPEQICL